MENKILGVFKIVYFGKLTIYQDRVEINSPFKKEVIHSDKIANVSVNKLRGQLIIETTGGGKTKVQLWGGYKKSEEAMEIISSGEVKKIDMQQIDTQQQHKSFVLTLPDWNIRWNKLSKSKKISVIVIVVILFIGFTRILLEIQQQTPQQQMQQDQKQTTAPSQNQPAQEQKTVQQKSETRPKEQAQKELDEVMKLAKQAGLIQSYEFSDKANIVYADAVWYTQKVQFKKDFLAKVAALKEEITGYHRFEVRDAYSNEKIAEVTAFSGSLEVYK